jgi:hypothetical protein
LTSVCLLEGDTEKVKRILQRDWMQNFDRASVETIQHAINANQSIGEHSTVERLLTLSKSKLHKVESHVECVLCTTQFESQEALLSDRPTRAARYNKKGSQLYANNQFEQSMYYYYKAHQPVTHFTSRVSWLTQTHAPASSQSYRCSRAMRHNLLPA